MLGYRLTTQKTSLLCGIPVELNRAIRRKPLGIGEYTESIQNRGGAGSVVVGCELGATKLRWLAEMLKR
jgi:hypothetical protein